MDAAVFHGADYLGFVFAKSKRQLSPEKVKEMTRDVPKGVKKIGVFVSPSQSTVETIIQQADLDMVQIHGELQAASYSVPLIRALSVEDTVVQPMSAEYVLFDAPPKQFAGGNGEVFDWEKLDLSQLEEKKIIIAGGLTAENVQQVKKILDPYAVDVSSGVETNGEKDLQKISAFLKKAKEELDV
ncbi:hypothetical protein RV12_GL000600 [Enterococcus quebecensis]|nr:hypothetical protein RV12_GL000600 [Enterococcus quebecensis]